MPLIELPFSIVLRPSLRSTLFLGGGGSRLSQLHPGHHAADPGRPQEQLRDPQDPAGQGSLPPDPPRPEMLVRRVLVGLAGRLVEILAVKNQRLPSLGLTKPHFFDKVKALDKYALAAFGSK